MQHVQTWQPSWLGPVSFCTEYQVQQKNRPVCRSVSAIKCRINIFGGYNMDWHGINVFVENVQLEVVGWIWMVSWPPLISGSEKIIPPQAVGRSRGVIPGQGHPGRRHGCEEWKNWSHDQMGVSWRFTGLVMWLVTTSRHAIDVCIFCMCMCVFSGVIMVFDLGSESGVSALRPSKFKHNRNQQHDRFQTYLKVWIQNPRTSLFSNGIQFYIYMYICMYIHVYIYIHLSIYHLHIIHIFIIYIYHI